MNKRLGVPTLHTVQTLHVTWPLYPVYLQIQPTLDHVVVLHVFIEKNQCASGLVQFKLIFKCQLSLEMAVTLQNKENTRLCPKFHLTVHGATSISML